MHPPYRRSRAKPGRAAGHEEAMTEAEARRGLIRLYILQAQHYNANAPPAGAGPGAAAAAEDDPPPAMGPERGEEAAYVEGLVASAERVSGCGCAELLAAGYALRRWAQRRPLAEQHTWARATACPHVTLVDGLASAEFTGTRAARDWYTLAATLRRVTLDGSSRTPVINDYVIEWVEENSDYLV